MSDKVKKSKKRANRPNINKIRERIREISKEYNYNEEVLLSFAEFVNGQKFKLVEPSMQELKQAVMESFNCSSYQQLKTETSFMLFVQSEGLRMTTKVAWQRAYRKFVGLPESERDAIGETAINGVDVLRNFLPWKVFALNPKTATAEDIKQAFKELAKKHHPDAGGRADIFDRLKEMRDSLLAAY